MNFLIDILAKSTIVLAICFAGLWALRRSSASARHLLLVLGLGALLALPLMEVALPRWEVPYLWVNRVEIAQVPVAAPVFENDGEDHGAIPSWWIAWALGAGLLTIRFAGGLVAVCKARRQPILPAGSFRQQVESLTGRRQVQLLLGLAGQSPMTWGIRKPILMLPPESEFWPTNQLQSVVLHEMAHIERLDWLTQTAARLGCALYWFHPGVWLLSRWMESESERAADDLVINQGCSPESYAEHLVEVARAVCNHRSAMAVSMARPSSIRNRLSAVLAQNRNRRPLGLKAKAGLFVAIALLATAVAAAGPRMVSQIAPVPAKPVATGPEVEITAKEVESVPPSVQPQQEVVDNSETEDAQNPATQDDSDDQPTRQPALSTRATVRNDIASAGQLATKEVAKAMKAAAKEVVEKGSHVVANVEEIDKATPEVNVDVPAIHVNTPNLHLNMAPLHFQVPSIHIHIPKIHVDVPVPNDVN